MYELLIAVIAAWLLVGVSLSAATESRGAAADALFVLTWPIHVVRVLLGKE